MKLSKTNNYKVINIIHRKPETILSVNLKDYSKKKKTTHYYIVNNCQALVGLKLFPSRRTVITAADIPLFLRHAQSIFGLPFSRCKKNESPQICFPGYQHMRSAKTKLWCY